MTFFTNPFKRQREAAEEVELGATPDALGPPTPPAHGATLGTLSAAATQPKEPVNTASTVAPDLSAKVRAKAAYFESMIKEARAHGSCAPSSSGSSEAGDSDYLDATEQWRTTTQARRMTTPAAAAEQEIESLRAQLAVAELGRKRALEALHRKTQEVSNLTAVVRELSESRAVALSARATLAEKYLDLQREHARTARVADLSRTVSKENLELTRTARTAAALAAKEAAEARKEAEAAARAEFVAAGENAMLRQKVSLLERLGLEEQVASACKREYLAGRVCETY